jgi:hypothetical protein
MNKNCLIVGIILLAFASVNAFAAVDVSLISSGTAFVNEDFEVTVNTRGTDAVVGFDLTVSFDVNAVKLLGITPIIAMMTPAQVRIDEANTTGTFYFGYLDGSLTGYTPTDGTDVCILTFTAKATSGTTIIRPGGTLTRAGFPPIDITGTMTPVAVQIVDETPYRITASAFPAEGGEISNPGEKIYYEGDEPEYTIIPNKAANYVLDTCLVNGTNVTADLEETDGVYTYKFPPMDADASIEASFKIGMFKVKTLARSGVTIEPVAGENTVALKGRVVTVAADTQQKFKIKFDEGYELSMLVIEDEAGNKKKVYELEDGGFYTLTVDRNYKLSAKAQLMHLISLTAMPAQGGAMNPAGEIWVKDRDSLGITITVNEGWDARLYVYPAGEMPAEATIHHTGDYPYALANIASDYYVDVIFEKDGTFHSADCDMDGEISLMEQMDFMELFKESAISGYHYDGITLSFYIDGCIVGYAAGAPEAECTHPHSADCNGDCFISLNEFLHFLELWKGGGYTKDPESTECNGFVPVEK